MGVSLDKAKAVRKGENLNEGALQQYLAKKPRARKWRT